MSRVHPGKPNPVPFLYSFRLEFSKDIKQPSYPRYVAMKNSFDRKAEEIPRIKSVRDGFALRTPNKNNLFITWFYTPPTSIESNTSQIGISVAQDFHQHIETLDGVVTTLPYAVKVFNKLSPLPLQQEAIDRTIRIARESDLIRYKAFRRR
jgi:hypothetical protein